MEPGAERMGLPLGGGEGGDTAPAGSTSGRIFATGESESNVRPGWNGLGGSLWGRVVPGAGSTREKRPPNPMPPCLARGFCPTVPVSELLRYGLLDSPSVLKLSGLCEKSCGLGASSSSIRSEGASSGFSPRSSQDLMMAWTARICSGSLFRSCATACCASADLWVDSVGHRVSERFSGVGYPWTVIRSPLHPSSGLSRISIENSIRV